MACGCKLKTKKYNAGINQAVKKPKLTPAQKQALLLKVMGKTQKSSPLSASASLN